MTTVAGALPGKVRGWLAGMESGNDQGLEATPDAGVALDETAPSGWNGIFRINKW